MGAGPSGKLLVTRTRHCTEPSSSARRKAGLFHFKLDRLNTNAICHSSEKIPVVDFHILARQIGDNWFRGVFFWGSDTSQLNQSSSREFGAEFSNKLGQGDLVRLSKARSSGQGRVRRRAGGNARIILLSAHRARQTATPPPQSRLRRSRLNPPRQSGRSRPELGEKYSISIQLSRTFRLTETRTRCHAGIVYVQKQQLQRVG